ncbi:MAG: hypothetical protein WCW26_02690 [Candidatus Buchananbacteria bacterium]
MTKLQEVFNKVQDTKRKQRELKRSYRDSLEGSEQYQNIIDQINILKEKKKAIEETFKKEFPQLERLKNDIESDNEILSDLTINCMIKGEPVEIMDEYNNQYQPILNVRFKKI